MKRNTPLFLAIFMFALILSSCYTKIWAPKTEEEKIAKEKQRSEYNYYSEYNSPYANYYFDSPYLSMYDWRYQNWLYRSYYPYSSRNYYPYMNPYSSFIYFHYGTYPQRYYSPYAFYYDPFSYYYDPFYYYPTYGYWDPYNYGFYYYGAGYNNGEPSRDLPVIGRTPEHRTREIKHVSDFQLTNNPNLPMIAVPSNQQGSSRGSSNTSTSSEKNQYQELENIPDKFKVPQRWPSNSKIKEDRITPIPPANYDSKVSSDSDKKSDTQSRSPNKRSRTYNYDASSSTYHPSESYRSSSTTSRSSSSISSSSRSTSSSSNSSSKSSRSSTSREKDKK